MRKFILAIILLTASCATFPKQRSPLVIDKARFTVIAPECVRMEYSETGKFIDAKSMFAVNRDARFDEFTLTQKDNVTVIDTGKLRLVYSPDGKPFSEYNLKAFIKKGADIVEWHPGQKNMQNLGGTIRTVDGVVGPINLGKGLLSRDGWYLLDDSRRHIFTDDWITTRPSGSGSDWYLFGYGYDYKNALKAFTKIGGAVPMPRKYVLGAWYSRYWPYSSDEYREIVKEYQEHDFPLDIVVMDMDWHKDGWTGWSWNRKLLPDAEDLLKWFHQQGLFVTLNVHPADGVGPHEDMYEAFMKDYGKDPSSNKVIPFDAGNKKYLDTLFKYTHEPHEREGVDFWWLDWQQYQYTLSIRGLENLLWLNHYYYEHTSKNNMRGQSFSRWGGWGDHRHPIHFSGDAHTGWDMLAFEIPLTSTAGNVGCFFWSHDMGGHMGPRNEESYTRWIQFGATTAALRSHSTRSAALDRRPWTYSKQAEESMKIAFQLRSKLFPYLYSTVWQSHKEPIPMNRPMYIEYPQDEKAYHNAQQYFWGDAFFVAPITSPGVGPNKVATQVVWFPPNGTWYNWFTGEKFSGNGAERVVTADIDEFPLYVKGGVPIPMQPYTQRMTTTPLEELIVRAYPGDKGRFMLYEDDGVSQDYMKGEYATTELSYMRNGDEVAITVAPTSGNYKGQLKERSYTIELPCTSKAERATVNGVDANIEYDAKIATNRIKVNSTPITREIIVNVRVKDADFEMLAREARSRRIAGITKDDVEMLYAILGIAVFKKNEGIYLYEGEERTYIYNALLNTKFKIHIINLVGDEKTEAFEKECSISPTAPLHLPEIQLPKPPLGISSKQVLGIDFNIGDKPISITKTLSRQDSFISQWQITGPFEFDPGKKLSKQKHAPEEDGNNVKWQKAESGESGIVNLRRYYDFDLKIAYAIAHLYSENEQSVTLKINSDDGVEVFLNGEKIDSKDVARSIYNEPDIVKATLKVGENTLLLKISQYGGDWVFKVGVESPNPVKESQQ